jgi:hypothetical protein
MDSAATNHDMPATLQWEPNEVGVLRFGGVLKQAEFAAAQDQMAEKIKTGVKPRLLAIAHDFHGWERGADWNDLDYMIAHADDIQRIAVVAESKWETKALAFAGAGVRKAPVKFFTPEQLNDARAWLVE